MDVRQEAFIQEYLIDLNATQAYIRAGYKPENANVCASKLLAKANIRARVDAALAERSKRTGVTQDRVIRELARVAFLDPTQLANMNTAMIQTNATEDDRAAISSVKVKAGEDFTEREIKFVDKIKALELLGKHLGMWEKKDGQGGQGTSGTNDTTGAVEIPARLPSDLPKKEGGDA